MSVHVCARDFSCDVLVGKAGFSCPCVEYVGFHIMGYHRVSLCVQQRSPHRSGWHGCIPPQWGL